MLSDTIHVAKYHNNAPVDPARVKVRVQQFVKLHQTATGNHLPYGITQCYLPPGRGDFPAFTLAEAGTRFSDPEGMQG